MFVSDFVRKFLYLNTPKICISMNIVVACWLKVVDPSDAKHLKSTSGVEFCAMDL